MNCKSFKKLLYLYQPGELKFREEKKLKKHLAKCSGCKKLSEKINSDRIILTSLKNIRPQAEDVKLLTNRIISNIEQKKPITRISTDYIELFATWFHRPAVKYSFLMILVLMTGSWLVQQINITNSIAKLENQVENYSPTEETNTSGLLNKIKLMTNINNNGSIFTYTKFFSLKKSINRLGIINRLAIYTELNNSPEYMEFIRSGNNNDYDLEHLFDSRNDILLKINEIITKRRNRL